MPTRIAIVEDHPVVRQGLRAWLAESEFQLVGEAGSAETAVAMIRGCHPDLLLLDVRLPGSDGLDLLSRLRDEGLRMPAVIFSGYDNPTFSARASAIGALGYLSKELDRDDLLAALRTAARNESCWSREELRRLTGALATDRVENDLEAPLTKRENEVLKQLAFGLSNKEIAQALGISYETAKEHVQHILRKIGVTDRTQAAVWAVRRGLV